jgi:hypothetical protein
MKEIIDRIQTFPDELKSITIQVRKYLNNNSNIDESVLNVLHRPWVAPLNWGLMLYKGAGAEWFEEFKKRTDREIPFFYKEFLKYINGGFIYGLTMYGLTPSIYETGLSKRTMLQCRDLTEANNSWITEYAVDPKLFHFAARPYSSKEIMGYFVDDEFIMCYRKNGELVNKWARFGDMLFDEVDVAEATMLEKVPANVKLNIADSAYNKS